MRRALAPALALCAACGGGRSAAPAPAPDAGGPGVAVTPPPPARPELPPGTRSLRLIRTVAARLGPDEAAKRIGTVAGDTRVGWRDAAVGPGCQKSWYAIDPQGWVCGDFLEPSPKVPSGVELPRLADAEIVPGTYGKVIEAGTYVYAKPKGKKKGGKDEPTPDDDPATDPDDDKAEQRAATAQAAASVGLEKGRPLVGSVNVRKYGELTANGKLFWKITRGVEEYLPASAIREHKPSTYQGTRLGDDTGLTLPLAFVWPRGSATTAWTHGAARGGGSRRQLKARAAVPVLETAQEGGAVIAYRIGDAEWIDAVHVRVARPMPLPAGVKPGERWLDIDLDQQLLVAYEGDLPVYATLVSTGLKDTPTETGVYRIWKKVSETDMKGLTGEDPYAVATVPWTQFFSPEKGLALHTSYWHDRFGYPKSHGCVNLAPRDARWLYFFSDPQVPAGWSMSAGVVEAPGSVVRVRSKADPDPPVRGYAQKVDDPDR
ncbi:MAG: L,D-transpeptidase [Myxococcales bacterium]|nr:L,D-transpeptidase [Myxococcales bacterium]